MGRYLHLTQPQPRQAGTSPIPVTTPLAGQVQNNAGGYSWAVDKWVQFQRWLILGSADGSYYASAQSLTRENIAVAKACIAEDCGRAMRLAGEISDKGRALKNDQCEYALAIALRSKNTTIRRIAASHFSQIIRTSTHLFHLCGYLRSIPVWLHADREYPIATTKPIASGRVVQKMLSSWYEDQGPTNLAYQMVKYRQRDGWTHRDVLREVRPTPKNEQQRMLYHWVVKGWEDVGKIPHPDEAGKLVWAYERAIRATSVDEVVSLIKNYGLPREAVPTQYANHPDVWRALMPLPMTALIRNLGNLSKDGVLTSSNPKIVEEVVAQLTNAQHLQKARVHPWQLLVASKVYSQGRGVLGSSTWNPVGKVVDALTDSFHASFGTIEPTSLRYAIGIDLSGSMVGSQVSGVPGMATFEAAGAIALMYANAEPNTHFVGFDTKPIQLAITKRQRLDDVIRLLASKAGGGTDCSVPIRTAEEQRLEADVFIILTDSEHWAGEHLTTCLNRYRQKINPQARCVVVAMCADKWSPLAPNDAGVLTVAGMDKDLPQVIGGFLLPPL